MRVVVEMKIDAPLARQPGIHLPKESPTEFEKSPTCQEKGNTYVFPYIYVTYVF